MPYNKQALDCKVVRSGSFLTSRVTWTSELF